MTNKINFISSFGQTPYQIINSQHQVYGVKTSKISNNDEDFEFELYHEFWNKDINYKIEFSLEFFIINYDSGLFFLINKEN